MGKSILLTDLRPGALYDYYKQVRDTPKFWKILYWLKGYKLTHDLSKDKHWSGWNCLIGYIFFIMTKGIIMLKF